MKQRALTDAESTELQNLRGAVYRAERARDEWLRSKGHELAALEPGDEIWDLDKYVKLGTVDSVTVDVEGHNVPVVEYWYSNNWQPLCSTAKLNCHIGSRDDALRFLREKLERMERE